MTMTATLNRVSDPAPFSFTKMTIPNAENRDAVIAELENEKGETTKVTVGEALEIYALWAAGHLSNSKAEVKYLEEHGGESLPAFQI